MKKNDIINEIIRVEGGYVNDPSDSGGETNYGITVEVARVWGYQGDMKDLPRETAFNIYADKYWDSVWAYNLLTISPLVAEEIVDTAVNMGVKRSVTFLQRCLNVLNNAGTLYDDLKVDGVMGNNTVSALAAYIEIRDDETLLKALNCLQGAFYIELAERREKDERFVYGWLKNRVKL